MGPTRTQFYFMFILCTTLVIFCLFRGIRNQNGNSFHFAIFSTPGEQIIRGTETSHPILLQTPVIYSPCAYDTSHCS